MVSNIIAPLNEVSEGLRTSSRMCPLDFIAFSDIRVVHPLK